MRRKPHIFIDGIEHKECCRCKAVLIISPENFNKNKQRWDGLDQRCRPCCKELYNENIVSILANKREYLVLNKPKIQVYRKQYRKDNPEKLAEIQREYWIKNKDHLRIANRERNIKNKDIYGANVDKVKKKAKIKEYLQTDRGKMVSRMGSQRRRTKKRSLPATFTNDQWNQCLQHFDNSCAYCGDKSSDLAQDHFLSLAENGEYSRENIVPSCKRCNSSKNSKIFFEWYPKQKYYSLEREQEILKYLGYKKGKQQLALF